MYLGLRPIQSPSLSNLPEHNSLLRGVKKNHEVCILTNESQIKWESFMHFISENDFKNLINGNNDDLVVLPYVC